ncbi:XkdX family protein [Lactobacillus sp. ESL0791]|uniref:XkdX family protein n=1 Tax=Lactobacillus sp. ESL0791 TaxID=2983234 RepID=UPI0023F7696B|nr:XkdX family protein [Lactobacillus sp. ESL0791]MDF7639930.1 XkdX family protein [Lactobacillus sp. ESL0791]
MINFHDILKQLYIELYQAHVYDNTKIANFVQMGIINGQDYKDITGIDYKVSVSA